MRRLTIEAIGRSRKRWMLHNEQGGGGGSIDTGSYKHIVRKVVRRNLTAKAGGGEVIEVWHVAKGQITRRYHVNALGVVTRPSKAAA